MTLQEMLEKTATQYPEREAVVWKSQRLTYESLFRQSARLSSYLIKHGLGPGDRVILLLENSPNYAIAYFGVLSARGCVVALNPNTTAQELKHPLTESDPSVIICQASLLPLLHSRFGFLIRTRLILVEGGLPSESVPMAVRTAAFSEVTDGPISSESVIEGEREDLAQIVYTSGTTGSPKGVMLTHANLLANTKSIVTYLGLSAKDRVFVILPFFYSYGNSLLLTHVYAGGTLVIAENFVFLNGLLTQMKQERVTGFSGVPSSYGMLLRQSLFSKTSFETLRYVTCAGGALSKPLIQEIQTAHPKIEIIIMYGQTEASARLSYLDPAELNSKLGSIGKGIPGVKLKVLGEDGKVVSPGEIGEIVAEGDCIMTGYWKNREETERVLKNGQLHTGDMATVDEEEYIYIRGRKSDIIKCGSYRTHPLEIEGALNANPDVVESAVVGIEDEILGESIVAFVVIRPGSSLSSAALLQSAREFLPTYKLPKETIFLEEIPKTASGKIKRGILRQHLGLSA